jgi:tetratricopeptide (TPR) repeat protein
VSAQLERALARAHALAHLRRIPACEAHCREALALSPGEPRALRLLAWVRSESGDAPGALESARALCAAAPLDIDARRALARALSRAGLARESVEAARACAAHPEATLEDLARLCRILSSLPEARDEALSLLDVPRERGSTRASYDLLRAAMNLGHRAHTERLAAALLRDAPSDPHYRAWVAAALLSLGRAGASDAHARAAIGADPTVALAWEVRARALVALGREGDAVECRAQARALRRPAHGQRAVASVSSSVSAGAKSTIASSSSESTA